MAKRLASFPYARANQPSANAKTKRATVSEGSPTLIEAPNDGRSYILLRVLNGAIRYFYKEDEYSVGMPVKADENVTQVNRNSVYLQSEDGAGTVEVAWDIGTA